jgi:hypothetical protein
VLSKGNKYNYYRVKFLNTNYEDEFRKDAILNGEIFLDYNIADFARKHNLERKQISAVLHGRFKSHLGWKFIFDDK